MWNAMILPYAVGPMQIAGTTWYQGEANTANSTTAAQYKCLFPEMITAWRAALKQPESFFGFVQLSTWCALPPLYNQFDILLILPARFSDRYHPPCTSA